MSILKQYSWQIALAILAFGLVFSILGVYDTHALPFYMRFTFWTVTMMTGILTSVLVTPFIVNRALKDKHPILQIVAGALLASLPVTLVLTLFNPTFNFNSSLIIWGLQYLYVLVISLVVGGIGYPALKSVGAIGSVSPENNQPAEQDDITAFLQRLPRKYQDAELYAFSAEDHYLRIYTSKGEELILLRFADALRELAAVNGLQVHRSWWVKTDSMVDVITADGRKVLLLKPGTTVPISRTFMKKAKQAFSF